MRFLLSQALSHDFDICTLLFLKATPEVIDMPDLIKTVDDSTTAMSQSLPILLQVLDEVAQLHSFIAGSWLLLSLHQSVLFNRIP